MKKANLILGSSVIILTGLLASCNPTTPEVPLAAPQNILTIPDDKHVTVLWDAVDDARVTGYNVYQDGTKVNAAPIAAKSRVTVQALSPRRLQFLVNNVVNLSKFSVRAISATGEGTISPESPAQPLVCTRHKVEGTDMGGLAQNVRLTKSAANLTTATVTVIAGGRTVIPFVPSASIYQGNLPATVAVGGQIQILTDDDNCLVYSYDSRPESPVMTAPAAGINVSSSAVLPVAWTNTTNPDRFVVVATWLEGSSGLAYRSGDLPGTARTFDIPAGSLPSDKAIKIRVYAYNDGTETFIGAFVAGSRMAIRNGDETGRDITTNPPVASTLPGVSWGDPHLITFDQSGVEFQSVGEFDLGFSSDNQLRVQARQQPWGGSTSVSVNTAIATRMNGKKVGLYLSAAGVSPLRIDDAGIRTNVPSSGLDLGGGHTITQIGNLYTLRFPTGDRIEVNVGGSYINTSVYPATSRNGTMKGLLGNMDGITTNDIFLRDGSALSPFNASTFYGVYADSWRIPTLADSLFVYDGSDAFGGFNDPAFPRPAAPIDPTTLATARTTCETAGVAVRNLEECAADVVITGDTGFATSAATVPNPVNDTVIPPAPKPDLIVKSASLQLGDVCRPYNTFVKGQVSIQNIGTATAVARSDVGVVQLVDARDELLGAGYRGNGVGIPEIPAGGSASVNVDIFYPISTPEDTEGVRTYVARVDFGNYYDELNETNNRLADTVQITIPAGHCKNKVGLIHGADNSAATAYKTGLELKGMRVTLLPLSSLNPNSTVTLMNYDLLAIDPKTYVSSYVWEGATGISSAIGGAGKPILGLGFGGSVFLQELQGGTSPIDWSSSWIITPLQMVRDFTVVNAAHPAIVGPFALTTTGGKVQVSDVDQEYSAANMPVIPSGVVGIGRDSSTLTTSPDHYSVAYNSNNQTAIWGFNGTPNYTDNGWKALANLGWFMLP